MPCKLSVIARSPDFLQCRIGLSGACCRSSTSFCSPHLSSATAHFPSSASYQCCQRPYILLPPIYDPTMAYAENIRMIQCMSQLPASATECAGKFSHHQLLALLVSKSIPPVLVVWHRYLQTIHYIALRRQRQDLIRRPD